MFKVGFLCLPKYTEMFILGHTMNSLIVLLFSQTVPIWSSYIVQSTKLNADNLHVRYQKYKMVVIYLSHPVDPSEKSTKDFIEESITFFSFATMTLIVACLNAMSCVRFSSLYTD